MQPTVSKLIKNKELTRITDDKERTYNVLVVMKKHYLKNREEKTQMSNTTNISNHL
jgi:arginine repressor